MTAAAPNVPDGHSMRHKRALVTRYGGPDVIIVIDDDIPARKAGEVRVKVLRVPRATYRYRITSGA